MRRSLFYQNIYSSKNSIPNSKKGDNMNNYEEEEEFFDNQVESVRLDGGDDDDDEDPKGTAFMRGVDEAQQIRDAREEDDEDLF